MRFLQRINSRTVILGFRQEETKEWGSNRKMKSLSVRSFGSVLEKIANLRL